MVRAILLTPIVVVTGALVAVTGCEKPSDAPSPAAPPAQVAPLSPEASFQNILETFREGVEEIPLGFEMRDGSGARTIMTGHSEVSHELVAPAKDGEAYKAIITVTSQSTYSMQRTKGGSTDQSEATDDADADASASDSGTQVFDSELVSSPNSASRPGSAASDKNAVAVAHKDEETERKYELIYEKGRWKLVTKLNPKTEGAIKLAFERALESQS